MDICETCRQQVRPRSEPGIVYAVELIPADTFGRRELVEGMGPGGSPPASSSCSAASAGLANSSPPAA